VRLAVWFHDAVCDSRRNDNEEQSAALAPSSLAGAAPHLLPAAGRLIFVFAAAVFALGLANVLYLLTIPR